MGRGNSAKPTAEKKDGVAGKKEATEETTEEMEEKGKKDETNETRNGYYVELGENDMFEGFIMDGRRHGESRCTWSDGDVMLCTWKQGLCKEHTREDTQKEKRQERAMAKAMAKENAKGKKILRNLQEKKGSTTRSRTAAAEEQISASEEKKKVDEPHQKQFFNHIPFAGSAIKQCVQCKNVCESEHFHCLNCKTAYCQNCEDEWMTLGYEGKRPPCFCVIDSNGRATDLCKTDFKTWIPKKVLSHLFKTRTTTATLQSTILIVLLQCASSVRRRHTCATLCCIGSITQENKAHLLKTEAVRNYVAGCNPKPSVFLQLENRWKLPPAAHPVAVNTEILPNMWSVDLFKMTRPDVDSLNINNFKLTSDSIKTRLTALIGRSQVDVGTTWSAVRNPKGYHTICGPRPVLLIYISTNLNANHVKKKFAQQLGKDTGGMFIPADSGSNVFKQSHASIDVIVLFNAWLKVVNDIQGRDEDDVDNQISKMKLLRIIFHAWKSDPTCIVDPFDQDQQEEENDMYKSCVENCSDFDVTYDLGQKYEYIGLNECMATSSKDRHLGISLMRVPVFGISGNFSGFQKADTWSMFGPIAGTEQRPMGSIIFDRTDHNDDTFLPINVKRVKVYPSIVNLTKATGFGSLDHDKFKGSFKQLKNKGTKVSNFVAMISGSDWKQYARMLMSFRIECTMQINIQNPSLQDLIQQCNSFQKRLLTTLSQNTSLGLVAIDDIRMLSDWCLQRYFKIFTGDTGASKRFHDKKMARDILLSLLHVMGYHDFPNTKHKHARFLIDLNMEEHITPEENRPLQEQKHVPNTDDFDWKNQTKRAMMLKPLKYMNVHVQKRTNTTIFCYMYKKICTISDGSPRCPWCHSSSKRLKNIEADSTTSRSVNNAACRSKDFQYPVDLALDVYARLQYHIQNRTNWEQQASLQCDHEEFSAIIEKLFFPAPRKKKANDAQIQVLSAIEEMVGADIIIAPRSPNSEFGASPPKQHLSPPQFPNYSSPSSAASTRNFAELSNSDGQHDIVFSSSSPLLFVISNHNTDDEKTDSKQGQNLGPETALERQDVIPENVDQVKNENSYTSNACSSAQSLRLLQSHNLSSPSSTASTQKFEECSDPVEKPDCESTSDGLKQGPEKRVQQKEVAAVEINDVVKQSSDCSDANHETTESSDGSMRNFVEPRDSDEQPGFGSNDIDIDIDDEQTGSKQERQNRIPENNDRGKNENSSTANANPPAQSARPRQYPHDTNHSSGVPNEEVAAVTINAAVQPSYGCEGIDNEPKVIKSIMFSMQGNNVHDAFQLDAYLTHWKLQLPHPKTRSIRIGNIGFELRDYGGTIEPFLHKATFDMLSNAQISDWLDLKANNSFLIHLAIAMNKVPIALHTAFARNCARNAQNTHESAWIPEVLAAVFPSTSNLQIIILSKSSENEAYISQRYGHPGLGGGTTLESSVVLMRDGKDYSWLRNVRIDDVKVKTFQQNFQNDVKLVSFESLMMKSVLIEGCHTEKEEAPSNEKQVMWNAACGKLGLQQQESGRWIVRPPGIELNLSLQDGSLTPQSFEILINTLASKNVNCTSVIDLGSEAGHAVAQFAFKPFVQQVTGIEIQFAWAAYSAIILQQIHSQCRDKGYHFAATRIIHGSFLSTQIQNPEWITALKSAQLCFCNNVNWDKGKNVQVASEQRRVRTGEYRDSINANVAKLLVDELQRNSHAVVFDATHFSSQAYEKVQTLKLPATWNTVSLQEVQVLRIRPCQFKDVETALRALCQDKNCNFDELPREWLQTTVQNDRDVNFVTLKDHVMRTNHFAKSNATVHEGWSVTLARVVCIKQFAQETSLKNIDREIEILTFLDSSGDASTHNVISFIGTDEDRRWGKVLIFELIHASNFNSDLRSMTAEQVSKYMHKLLQALHYLHNRGVVHRDLKPANFLHNFESDTFRLIDFGSAVKGIDAFGKKGGGTEGFKSPETLTNSVSQTSAVDIWSAGIILFSLLTGKKHVLSEKLRGRGEKACEVSHLREIGEIVGTTKMKQWNILQSDEYGNGCQCQNKTGWAAKALQTVIPERSWKPDDQALDLLSQMLEVDPTKRIKTLTALEHPFLKAKK